MRSEPMAWASRWPRGRWFRRRGWSGEGGLRGLGIKGAEKLRAGAALVAAQANSDDRGVGGLEFGGLAEDALGLLDGKVAHGIEDPVESEVQLAFSALPGSLQSGEYGLKGGGSWSRQW